jgi:hypothetical protein
MVTLGGGIWRRAIFSLCSELRVMKGTLAVGLHGLAFLGSEAEGVLCPNSNAALKGALAVARPFKDAARSTEWAGEERP